MDLKKLSGKQVYVYNQFVKQFMKEHKLRYFGPTSLAIDQFPEIDDNILRSKKAAVSETTAANCAKLGRELEEALTQRFDLFYSTCVKDPSVANYLQSMVMDIKHYSQLFLSIEKSKLDEFGSQASDNAQINLSAFSNLMGAGGADINDLVNEAYQKSMS